MCEEKNEKSRLGLWAQGGVLAIAIILISGSLGYMIGADGPSGFGTVIEPGSMVSESQYIIFNDGGTCYRKNGTTGEIDQSNANATIVIQAALDDLTIGRTSQEKISLQGDFEVYSLDVYSFTIIEIRGSLTLTNSANDYLLHLSTVNHVTIENGVLDGNKAGQAVESHILYVYDSHNITIQNCEIFDSSHSNIQLTSSEDVLIEGNQLSGSTHNSVWSQASERVQILGNIVTDSGSDGFDIRSASHDVIIANNIVRYTTHNGVFLTESAYNVTVQSNRIEHCSLGIWIYGGFHDGVIANNIVSDSTTLGIYLSATALEYDAPYHVSVIGNQVKYSGTNAIGLRGGVRDSIISNNLLSHPTSNGIIFVAEGTTYLPTNITINGNTIIGPGVDGISASSVSLSYSTIISNSITDAGGYGIWIYVPAATPRPHNLTIMANQVDTVVSRAMGLGRIDNAIISENRLSNSGIGSVMLHNSNFVVFSWNTILNPTETADATYPVFYDLGNIDNCTIVGNKFLLTSGSHPTNIMAIPGGSDNNIIELNDFRDCTPSTAILTNGGTGNTIRYNLGYVTENAGYSTITGAVTTVDVTHGLSATPNRVFVTGDNVGIGDYWVTAFTATTFTISFELQPGGSTWGFRWYALAW